MSVWFRVLTSLSMTLSVLACGDSGGDDGDDDGDVAVDGSLPDGATLPTDGSAGDAGPPPPMWPDNVEVIEVDGSGAANATISMADGEAFDDESVDWLFEPNPARCFKVNQAAAIANLGSAGLFDDGIVHRFVALDSRQPARSSLEITATPPAGPCGVIESVAQTTSIRPVSRMQAA